MIPRCPLEESAGSIGVEYHPQQHHLQHKSSDEAQQTDERCSSAGRHAAAAAIGGGLVIVKAITRISLSTTPARNGSARRNVSNDSAGTCTFWPLVRT